MNYDAASPTPPTLLPGIVETPAERRRGSGDIYPASKVFGDDDDDDERNDRLADKDSEAKAALFVRTTSDYADYFDLNGDGEVNIVDLLSCPLMCYDALELILGIGFKSIPIGASVGSVMVIIGLQQNLAGIVKLHEGLQRFSVDLSSFISWVSLGFTATIVLDSLIVFHGLVGSIMAVENDYCGRGAGKCCNLKCNSCLESSLSVCGCCLRSTYQVFLAIVGSILLWLTFFAFLGEVVAGTILTVAFIGIEKTCDFAIPIAREQINNTASHVLEFYESSGIRSGVQAVSNPPFRMNIENEVYDTVNDISTQANSYVAAVEQLCELFDGMSQASQMIAVGALLSIIAQVIVMAYHIKYFTVWWYENKRVQEKLKRHNDSTEPEYVHPGIKRALDKADEKKAQKIELALRKISTKHDKTKMYKRTRPTSISLPERKLGVSKQDEDKKLFNLAHKGQGGFA
eukprot:jgi/Bigna1/129389/aug1.9_g4097